VQNSKNALEKHEYSIGVLIRLFLLMAPITCFWHFWHLSAWQGQRNPLLKWECPNDKVLFTVYNKFMEFVITTLTEKWLAGADIQADSRVWICINTSGIREHERSHVVANLTCTHCDRCWVFPKHVHNFQLPVLHNHIQSIRVQSLWPTLYAVVHEQPMW
jgi:hypothetical protein